MNGPLKQYFSPYPAVSTRGKKKREMIEDERKMAKQPPHAPTTNAVGPGPTIIQIRTCRTPRHWKFTQPAPSLHPTPPTNEGIDKVQPIQDTRKKEECKLQNGTTYLLQQIYPGQHKGTNRSSIKA